MLCDYHVHTEYSDDSVYEMEICVKDALNLGIDEMCFTDHVDYGIKVDKGQAPIVYHKGKPMYNVDYEKYFNEIHELSIKYPEIKIKRGLEFGMQRDTIQDFQKIFIKYPLDFVILSVHQINNEELWLNDYQKNKTQDEYNLGYYEELLFLVKNYKDYSVLGHLDLIARYDKEGSYPFPKLKDIVSEILKIVISDGKGIEVNTSSHRYGLNDMTPSRDILKLYKELGGSVITIGSDSHRPEHLAKYLNETRQELKKIGFRSYCTFDNMIATYHEL
ncbi:histidinol-phosphatase HisJ family protein [Anaerorhabdus sp.]|uniref:histidinol-phosphatase HisJ family protein n=1 Tax=Anaerorhabdus sp. TaxID=1872524 RepID=UPI002FCC0CD8